MEGKGTLAMEKGMRERGVYKKMHKENNFPKLLVAKTRGADFLKFLQQVGLEDWNFNGQRAFLG